MRRREREESEACRSSGSSTTKCVSSFFSFSLFTLTGDVMARLRGRERTRACSAISLARDGRREREARASLFFSRNEEHSTKERTSERNVFFFVSR
jgi:hypothetical protein